VAQALTALQTTGLNARDLKAQHRGYYEQLDVRAQPNAAAGASARKRDARWQDLSQLDVLNERHDLMLRDLRTSRQTLWNGNRFSTNRWGMRDRDYGEAKPAGTLRIALLGPSHVMGNGVSDGEPFEALIESDLDQHPPAGFAHVEILNFGVDGFSLPQQLALLEDRVFRFDPDVVIATHYQDNLQMTESFLEKVAVQHVPVGEPSLQRELRRGGLTDTGAGGLPIPFSWARAAAGAAGLTVRMPSVEISARARRIAPAVLEGSFERFSELTRAHDAVPAVLALNVVIDDVPAEVPYRAAIERAGLTLFDLFDVFPPDRRAELRVAPWDDHPNRAGHRLIADRLEPQLRAFLASDTRIRRRTPAAD
jgi:hypothetical protein